MNDATTTPQRMISFFGYLSHIENGRERILVRKDPQYQFPITGSCLPPASPEEAIDRAVQDFVAEIPGIQKHFVSGGFSSPEIREIHLPGQKRFAPPLPAAEVSPTPVFFKVALDEEIPPLDERFVWIDKRSLLASSSLEKSLVSPLDAIRYDRIYREFGRRVLECVDVLVFRETAHGEREFLVLKRSQAGNALDERWEYPKGGLEYHETVHEGAIRELLEETGIRSTGSFRFGGSLGYQTVDVAWRKHPEYDTLRVHGVTYLFYGREEDLQLSEEHIDYAWLPFEVARARVTIGEYSTRFFDRWWETRWDIMLRVAKPVSLAFQVTEDCPLGCSFCLRRQADEQDLTLADKMQIVDILACRGILRLTITGGEPLLPQKKEDTLQLLEHAHAKRIHTCLSTTGYNLTSADMERLTKCLDQLLLSIHSHDELIATKMYDEVKVFRHLHREAAKVLGWTRDSPIIVEISTVVSLVNRAHLIDMGHWLFNLHPGIFWRLEEYYANGAQAHVRKRFELQASDFELVKSELTREFDPNRLRFSSKESRSEAPDVMITPRGNIVTSAHMQYSLQGDRHDLLFIELKNRRPWRQYRDCVRTDWNW